MSSIQNIPLTRIDGSPSQLADFAGQVLLVVNVASKCGLTPQYAGLEQLYQAKRGEGLAVLGFPANNFKGQEPGTDAEIMDFCTTEYKVQFPLFSKLSVAGADQHPLYQQLIKAQPTATGDGPFRAKLQELGITPSQPPEILWNFEKFLVGRNGEVLGRFAPDVGADDPRLLAALDAALAQK